MIFSYYEPQKFKILQQTKKYSVVMLTDHSSVFSHNPPRLGLILSHLSPVHILSPYFHIYINIIIQFISNCSMWYKVVTHSKENFIWTASSAMYAICFPYTSLGTCIIECIIFLYFGFRESRETCFSGYCIGESCCVRYIVMETPSTQLQYGMVYYILIY